MFARKEKADDPAAVYGRRPSMGKRIMRDLRRYWLLYIMAIPMVLYYVLFMYQPMYGAIIAFKDFSPGLGIAGSPWAGLRHFRNFFYDIYFGRLLRNTISISLKRLIVGFPAPILLALMLNELRQKRFKKVVQTMSYLPHFVSLMVICGLVIDFTRSDGVINDIVAFFGFERQTMLLNPKLFPTIYILSDIWQGTGWGSIVYLAALTGIDQELYEAACIDGAGRLRQTWHITLPGIQPIMVIKLILDIGEIMSVSSEKIILLYNPITYETADVISSYVYRKGVLEAKFSYSTAVGLFNSVVNFSLVIFANWFSRKVNETSLW